MAIAVSGVACAISASAQDNCIDLLYSAASGERPPAELWQEVLADSTVNVSKSRLHCWTADGLQLPTGHGIDYTHSTAAPDEQYRWRDGRVFEARLRVIHGGGGFTNPTAELGYRAATFIQGVDADRQCVYLWVSTYNVCLSTNFNAHGGTGTVVFPFDAESAFHTYRVETDANEVRLWIDGVLQASVPYHNSTVPCCIHTEQFGQDGRYFGGAESDWEYVRFSRGNHPAPTTSCIGGSASFEFRVTGDPLASHQWQAEESPGSDVWYDLNNGFASGIGTVSGATSNRLDLSNLLATADIRYRCTAVATCGPVESRPALLSLCTSDFNCDGIVNSTDVSDFISQWFDDLANGTLVADIDDNGIVNSTDVSTFINQWFEAIAFGCY